MKLNRQELEFLSAWAREEKSANPYSLPAHQLQATHKVPGVTLIRALKAWARSESRKDEEIFNLYDNPNPTWPWSSEEEMTKRLTAASSAAPAREEASRMQYLSYLNTPRHSVLLSGHPRPR